MGYKVAFAEKATAIDVPPNTLRGELRYRIRGTAKTVASLSGRYSWRTWLRRPGLAWSVFSHRAVRYASPYALIMLLISNVALASSGGVYAISLLGLVILFGLTLSGWMGEASQRKIGSLPKAGLWLAVAMLGMMIGVARALTGGAPSSYSAAD